MFNHLCLVNATNAATKQQQQQIKLVSRYLYAYLCVVFVSFLLLICDKFRWHDDGLLMTESTGKHMTTEWYSRNCRVVHTNNNYSQKKRCIYILTSVKMRWAIWNTVAHGRGIFFAVVCCLCFRFCSVLQMKSSHYICSQCSWKVNAIKAKTHSHIHMTHREQQEGKKPTMFTRKAGQWGKKKTLVAK